MENGIFKMNRFISKRIKKELDRQFPEVHFTLHFNDISQMYVIATNDSAFFFSRNFTRYLGKLKKKYAPFFDIFDLCYDVSMNTKVIA